MTHNYTQSTHTEERRKKVLGYLAMNMTQEEIAGELHVDQSTVSRDVKYLREESRKFIADLAKATFGFIYRTSLEGVDQVIREAWLLFRKKEDYRLLSLLMMCYAEKMKLLADGPVVHAVNSIGNKYVETAKNS